MDKDSMKILEANEVLSAKLSEVINERDKLLFVVQDLGNKVQYLEKALEQKMKVARIIVNQNDINYRLQILKEYDTPEGLFIEGRI